jgi:hypothetical protein
MAELRAALLQRATPLIEQAAAAVAVALQARATVVTKINKKIDTDIVWISISYNRARMKSDDAAKESAEQQLAQLDQLRQRQSWTPDERIRNAAIALLDALERALQCVKTRTHYEHSMAAAV